MRATQANSVWTLFSWSRRRRAIDHRLRRGVVVFFEQGEDIGYVVLALARAAVRGFGGDELENYQIGHGCDT